jgi:hypothetical protein
MKEAVARGVGSASASEVGGGGGRLEGTQNWYLKQYFHFYLSKKEMEDSPVPAITLSALSFV